MSLTLRIRLSDTSNGSSSGAVRSMRFAGNMSVHEACKTIIEKNADLNGGRDHGLYKPLTDDSGTRNGKWLRPEKILDFYDLKQNVSKIF